MLPVNNKLILRSWSKRLTFHLVVSAICLIVIGGVVSSGFAQEQQQSRKPSHMGFSDLVGGLKATEGCLGIETAKTSSGKNVIFAWFENKQAVLNWYYSDMHQSVQKAFLPDVKPRKPLEGVPDDVGPIMAIASITFSDQAHFEESGLPISQIAIELYTPITGGLFLGSRFAPEGVRVTNMKDYTPEEK